MICEKCKKREATVKLIKVVNGKRESHMFCEECINGLGDILSAKEKDEIDDFNLNKILDGLVDYLGKSRDEKELQIDGVCKKCGTTYKEIKESGNVGCCECYEFFELGLIPIMHEYHGSSYHKGNKNFSYILADKKNLEYLQHELEEAIEFEEYERAAIIRDEIKKIKSCEEA